MLYGLHAQGFSGLRFSRSPEVHPLSFDAERGGRFLRSEQVPAFKIQDGRWHSVELKFEGGQVAVQLDGQAAGSFPAGAEAGSIGFRGGYGNARVAGIEAGLQDGTNWRGGILRLHGFGKVLLLNLAVLALILGVASLAGRRSGGALAGWWPGSMAGLTLVGLLWLGFEYFYWSKVKVSALNPPVPANLQASAALGALHAAERARFHGFDLWFRLAGGQGISLDELGKNGYPARQKGLGPLHCLPGKGCQQAPPAFPEKRAGSRIVMLGTSQTYGSGADRLDDTILPRLLEALGRRGVAAEGLNLAKIASFASHQLGELCQFTDRPDLVIANFGNNDSPESLRPALEGIAERARALGARLLLLEEANPKEFLRGDIQTRHRVIREVAAGHGVTVLPFHEFLNTSDAANSGMLWWDGVHLSTHGQRLAAEWLAPHVIRELRRTAPPAGGKSCEALTEGP